ncbi:MAG: TetR/AcrR family transcriptional regulator, partial [Chloroflexota bacterium]
MPKKIYDEAVFQVVVDTLVERGYAGATTKHIAEIAGISEVSLFRKYGSKAELVLTAVRGHIFNPTANDALYTGDVFADLLRLVTLYDKAPEHNASL